MKIVFRLVFLLTSRSFGSGPILALSWPLWLAILVVWGGMGLGVAWAAPMKIVVSVVGPRNLSYLPIDLIPKIGADRAENAEVQLLHVGGGGLAIKQMLSRNSDFSAVGFSAIMSLKANCGGGGVGVAAVADRPLFVLIVRAGLQDQVKRIADLKGRVIGVHTSAVNAKTTAQQLIELLLRSDGLDVHDARIISTGQDWEERERMIRDGTVDAIVAEEPFASVLLEEKKVFFLANLADESTSGRLPGANFLHTSLVTRPDIISSNPEKVGRMVKILLRSLAWIAAHTPEELVNQFQMEDRKEREMLLLTLKKYPEMFSRDGKFTREKIAGTNRFFSEVNPQAPSVRMEDLIDPRWVGGWQ